MFNKNNRISLTIDFIYIFLGNFFIAFAISTFVAPNNIAPGGTSGIAIMINYIFSLPIGAVNFIINIPLLIIAFLYLGKIFVLKTVLSICTFSFCTDILFKNVYLYKNDMMMAMLFAGILSGIGAGLVFLKNGSTGGSDIIALFIKSKHPHFRTGGLVMIVDTVIIVFSIYIFKNIEVAMYAIVYKVTSSIIIDKVIYGLDGGKMLIINSVNHSEVIKEYITHTMSKGVTVISSYGGYSKDNIELLLCAVSKRSFVELRRQIKVIDPQAFVIVTNVSEILGLGFSQN